MKLDEIDVRVLRALLKDARASLKEIAKECNVSPNAIFKRIRHLEDEGLIVGTILYANLAHYGRMYPASIEVDLRTNQEKEVTKLISERASVFECSQSIGKHDLWIFLVAKSINELDNIKRLVRKHPGVNSVTVSLWTRTQFTFENLKLLKPGSEQHERS
jgi:Lrp/AsnC family transcriptional regulator, leucine-responsive regulatory protein